MRIVVGGPPHSGKSVFLWYLKSFLPIGSYMPVRAAPDGEGDWTQHLYQGNAELAQELRQKGTFSSEFVDWAAESVRNCTDRFCLVDIGGRVTDENRRICNDADGLIILAGDMAKVPEWQEFAAELGLKVLAIVGSTLDHLEEWRRVSDDGLFEGLCVNLDRATFTRSATIENLVQHLLDTIPNQNEDTSMSQNALTIAQIARLIDKTEEDYTSNGRQFHGLNWRPEDLPKVEAALKPFSALGMPWVIDGPGPQWLIACIHHALHPCPVSLKDTKVEGGQVPIGSRKHPTEGGAGDLDFTVEKLEMGALVRYGSENPIRAELLPNLLPPSVPAGTPAVFLNGRTATWAVVEVVGAYQHVVPAVYVGQPMGDLGYGYVCAVSHNADHKVGSVVWEKDLK